MEKVKIGFLPLSWDAWDHFGWSEVMRDRSVAALEKIPGVEWVVPSKEMTGNGCVQDWPQAEMAAKLYKEHDIRALVVGNMNFGMETALGIVLNAMPKDLPLLHFTCKADTFKEGGVRSSDTWCGAFMANAAIKRRGWNYIHINSCWPEDEAFLNKVESFVRCVNAIDHFRGARIGQMGPRPMLFESQPFNEQLMEKKFSQLIVPVDMGTIFSRLDSIKEDDPRVIEIAKEIHAGANCSACTECGINTIARFEVTLEELYKEHGMDCMGAMCWSALQERYGIAACSTFGRLNDKKILTACEMDTYGALTMLAMFHAALGEETPNFIDFTELHPTDPNAWLAWHCGAAAPSLCMEGAKKDLIENAQLKQWSDSAYGVLQFKLKPGKATFARLVEYDGEFTMFIGTGEVTDMEPATTGTYGWVKVNSVDDWETKMIDAGVTHHGVMIYDSKVADALELFCKFMGIRVVRAD